MIAFVAVFTAYFVLDIVWAWYTKAIATGHALRASLWAGVIPLLVMTTTILVVGDPWLMIAAAGGGAIGTYVALTVVAGVGHVRYEIRIGKLWIGVVKPEFWGSALRLIRFTWGDREL